MLLDVAEGTTQHKCCITSSPRSRSSKFAKPREPMTDSCGTVLSTDLAAITARNAIAAHLFSCLENVSLTVSTVLAMISLVRAGTVRASEAGKP